MSSAELSFTESRYSMWPLLKKDGLGLQYIALLVLWNRLIGYNPLRLPTGTFVQLLSLVILFSPQKQKHNN